MDREADRPIPAETVEQLLSGMARCMDEIDLVLVSDYNKGVCKGDLIPRLVKLARAAGVPVIADPVRDADYRRYAGCACITPNRVEAGLAVGHADHHAAGRARRRPTPARLRRRFAPW